MVARALLTCLVIAGLLFALQTYIGALLTQETPAMLAADPASQGDAYYRMVGDELAGWLQSALSISKAGGAAFSAMVGQAAASRILLDMGREDRLPKVLAAVEGRTGVPAVGVVLVAGFNVVIAVWAATTPNGLDVLVSVVSVGAICASLLLHASVIGHYWVRRAGGPRRAVPHLLSPLIGAEILLVVLIEADRTAQLVGAGWLAAGIAVAAVQHRRRVSSV